MMPNKKMDVFAKLYDLPLVEVEECWSGCSGGFCCANNHPDFKFRFMTINGTDIIYLPREYAWAEKYRKTFHNQTGQIPHSIELDLGAFSIGIVYEKCQLRGKCGEVIDKPLLCRFYPFLPVFSYEGELEELIPASVFDLTFEAVGMPSSCPVIKRKKADYFKVFQENRISDYLDTYVKFYLRCAKHFVSLMGEGISENADLKGKQGEKFWQLWEKLHLSGQLVDFTKLNALVVAEYDKAKTFDPGFTMTQESGLIKNIRKKL